MLLQLQFDSRIRTRGYSRFPSLGQRERMECLLDIGLSDGGKTVFVRGQPAPQINPVP